MIEVFDKNGVTRVLIEPDSQSSQQKQLMQQDIVVLSFRSPNVIDFQIDDYCIVFGQTYRLNKPAIFKKASERDFSYTLNLEGEQYDLTNVEYEFLDNANDFVKTSFSLMGNAQSFADLILINLNNRYPGEWSLGTVINSDTKNLTFSGNNCLEVLSQIATEFQTEFFFVGKQINIYKRQENSGLRFTYGFNKGLKSLERNNKDSANVITHLNVFGGTQNLPANYRNGSPNLLMPGKYFLEQNTDKYRFRGATVNFPDIFPNRIGAVTSVIDDFTFVDATLDFELGKQLIPGVEPKIKFNTGQLAGYTFTLNDYNDADKSFKLNINVDEKAIQVPSQYLKATVGDQYIIIDMIMPQSYIDTAEAKLESEGQIFFTLNRNSKLAYVGEADPLYFMRNNIELTLGFNIGIYDPQIKLDAQIRINSFTRNVRNKNIYTFTLDETPASNVVANIIKSQTTINNVIRNSGLNQPNRARLNYIANEELIKNAFDPDGNTYTAIIKPLVVQTTSLLVGAKSQQLNFDAVIFNPNVGGNPASFSNTAGIVYNETILATGIRSWNVAAGQYINLEDGKPYYVYVKAEKIGNNSTIFLSQTSIVYDSLPDFYYFYVGFLGSPQSGVRPFALTYGYTTINGQFISTGRIQPSTGKGSSYIDLNGDVIEFRGRVILTDDSPAAISISLAERNATIALTATQNFQSQINSLNATILNISNDNILSASEKQTVYLEYQAIINEHDNILQQGIDYGVSLDYYTFAFGSFTDYFNYFQLLNDLTTDSPIDGNDFRYRFSNYYTAKSFILKDIAYAAKSLTANSLSAAQNAQLTANNASLSAKNAQTTADSNNIILKNIADDNILSPSEKQIVSIQYTAVINEHDNIVAQANSYSINLDYYNFAYGSFTDYFNYFQLLTSLTTDSGIDGNEFRFRFSNYYTARSGVLKAIQDATQALANLAKSNAAVGIANAQNALNVATTVQGLTNFLSSTTIAGNVVATGLLIVGDATSANALISGVTDKPNGKSVRYASGLKNYLDKDNAVFRVLDDGTMYCSSANISGNINALTGQIANWNIKAGGGLENTDQTKNSYVSLILDDGSGNLNQASLGTGFLNSASVREVPMAIIQKSQTNGTTNVALKLIARNGGNFGLTDRNPTVNTALDSEGAIRLKPSGSDVYSEFICDTFPPLYNSQGALSDGISKMWPLAIGSNGKIYRNNFNTPT